MHTAVIAATNKRCQGQPHVVHLQKLPKNDHHHELAEDHYEDRQVVPEQDLDSASGSG